MPPRESKSFSEIKQPEPTSKEPRTLSTEKVRDRRPVFPEKFTKPQDYLDTLNQLYATNRDLEFWTKDNLRSLVADSGIVFSREDIDRLTQEFAGDVHQAKGQFNQVVRALLEGQGVQDTYKQTFGQEIKDFNTAKAQAVTLLQSFYDLYSQLLSEHTSQEAQSGKSLRSEAALQASEDTKDTTAWEVAAVAIPPAGYTKKEQKAFEQRRALWDEAVAKLQLLPGPHQEAFQTYLKDRNSSTARHLIEQFPNLVPSPKESRLDLKFKREDVRDLEIFLEQVTETAIRLAHRLGIEIKPGESSVQEEIKEQTPEGKEIKINLAEVLQNSLTFYNAHNLLEFAKALPQEIKLSRDSEARLREALRQGFDHAVLLPEMTIQQGATDKLFDELATKPFSSLSEAKQYTSPYIYKPEVTKLATPRHRPQKAYLLLYSSSSIPQETKDQTPNQLDAFFESKKWNGLTLHEFLILQRKELENNKDHRFDAYNDEAAISQWTWLLDSRVPRGVVDADWRPASRRVGVSWGGPGDSSPRLGARPAVVVELEL